MITANKARQIAIDVRLKALKGIEERIKSAAEQGLDCIWEEFLDSYVLGELEKSGYEVTFHEGYDTSEYCISWEKERK